MRPNPRVDTALHVLKGAVQKVLGTPLTTAVFAEVDKGRLTVEFEGKPTDEQMAEIGRLANDKIAEDVPLESFEMGRAEAEKEFGNTMYDKFPVPASVTTLTLVRIPEWNLNCCLGPHTERTGELVKITITKWRARGVKKTLEISFTVE